MRRLILFTLLIAVVVSQHSYLAQTPTAGLRLPLKDKSVRFAVIGDMGTGKPEQYEVAKQMAKYHDAFPFDFVLMLGDNIYGGHNPADMKKKFEDPYKPLLDGGVKFYASLGNHDSIDERLYKPFNMGGQRYYNFKNGNVEFFALDSTYMSPEQLSWVMTRIPASGSNWKICFFHHPLYSHGKFHGSDMDLRARLEPILQQRGVQVVLSGHDHVYERLKPQKGIYYFVVGNSGQLREGNLKRSEDTAKGFDTDQSFMLVEVAGDRFFFQTISRTGETIDSGVIDKQMKSTEVPARPNTKVAASPAP
jgi:predicted phosphodiesterase